MVAKKSPAKKTPSPSDIAEKAMLKYVNAPTNRAQVLPLKKTVSAKFPDGRFDLQGRVGVAAEIGNKAYKAAVVAKGIKAIKKKK